MPNFLKILFKDEPKWTQIQSEGIKVTNRSPYLQIKALSSSLCWGIVVLFSCVYIGPCHASGGCHSSHESQENLHKLTRAINELTFDLYRSMAANSTGNLFFSPLSISTAFEMIFYGTRGYTAEELRNVLGYNRQDLPTALVHPTFRDLLCNIQSSAETSSEEPSLTLANALVVDESLPMWPDYKDELQRLYHAYVRNVNFGRDTQSVVQEINDWVRTKTKGRIGKLVDRLDSLTLMVLLNAVHFKGAWQQQFEMSNTKPILFYNHGLTSQAKQVPMMRITHSFRNMFGSGFQAVQLPYKGNSTSMVIMLPRKRDGLAEFEKTLTLEKLAHIQDAMLVTDTRLVLPKFKFEYSRELSQDFRALGVHRIFDEGFGDFSGMTPSMYGHVSGVLHKAVIEVNEEGSEAAAASGIVMRGRSMPAFFMVDHPFVFAIVNKKTGVILLMGRVSQL